MDGGRKGRKREIKEVVYSGFFISASQADVPTTIPPTEVAMETDKEGHPHPAEPKRHYIDSTYIHVPRKGAEMQSPMKDGMSECVCVCACVCVCVRVFVCLLTCLYSAFMYLCVLCVCLLLYMYTRMLTCWYTLRCRVSTCLYHIYYFSSDHDLFPFSFVVSFKL